MTNKTKLNRRDAIKVLGAAGASVLANIPAKWSKPELAGGNLPAHAQTSGCGYSMDFYAGPEISSGPSSLLKFNALEHIGNLEISQGNETSSYYAKFPCQTLCFGLSFYTLVNYRISINIFDSEGNEHFTNQDIFSPGYNYLIVDGTTGEHAYNTPPGECIPFSD